MNEIRMFFYLVHKKSRLFPVLRQINAVSAFPSLSLKIPFNIVVATGVVNPPMPPLCSAFREMVRFPLLPTRTGTNNVRSQCSYLFSS